MDGGGGTKALVVLNRDGPCLGGCPGLERIVRVVVEVCEGARSLPSSLYRIQEWLLWPPVSKRAFQMNGHHLQRTMGVSDPVASGSNW